MNMMTWIRNITYAVKHYEGEDRNMSKAIELYGRNGRIMPLFFIDKIKNLQKKFHIYWRYIIKIRGVRFLYPIKNFKIPEEIHQENPNY